MSEEQLHEEAENLEEEEELSPDHALSLRDIFGEKIIKLGEPNRLIRWVTALGFAQIIAAVVLMGLNLVDMPSVTIKSSSGDLQVAIPLLVACLVSIIMAWTWLVTGALHSRLLLRIPILTVFFLLQLSTQLGATSTVTGWTLLVLFLAYAVWHGIAKPQGHKRDLIVMGLGISFFYIALIDQVQLLNPSFEMVTLLFGVQVSVAGLLLMPMVMFAGLDLGESVRDISRWAIGQAAARAGDGLMTGIALAICLAKLAGFAVFRDFSWGWLTGGLFLLAVGYLTVRMRPWEGLYHEPPFWIVFVGAVLSVGTLLIFIVAFRGRSMDFTAWTQAGSLSALAGGIAVFLTRARRDVKSRTIATFLSITALWGLFRVLGAPPVWGGLLHLPGSGFLDFGTLDNGATVLVLALLIVLIARGLTNKSIAAWAIALTVGLSIIRGMVWLVNNNFELSAATAAAQLAVMAIGILWDVATSGDRFTNGHSDRMPRSARVLLYFGYVSLSMTALLFFKGSGQEDQFNSDQMAITGLMILGIPLYLYGFARAGTLLVRQAAERKRHAA